VLSTGPGEKIQENEKIRINMYHILGSSNCDGWADVCKINENRRNIIRHEGLFAKHFGFNTVLFSIIRFANIVPFAIIFSRIRYIERLDLTRLSKWIDYEGSNMFAIIMSNQTFCGYYYWRSGCE
jgi:hypothetical protein